MTRLKQRENPFARVPRALRHWRRIFVRRMRDLSIKTKLVLLATASGCAALLLCSVGFIVNDLRTMRSAKLRQLEVQADILGFNSTAVLTFGDAGAAGELLESLKLHPSIEAACLFNAEGSVLASYAKQPARASAERRASPPGYRFTEGGCVELFHQVVDDGNVVGTLYLLANMDDLHAQLWSYVAVAAVMMLCSLGAAILLSVRLQGAISLPILRLAQAAKRISTHGIHSIRVERDSRDEIGTLYAAFNHMLDQIETSKAALQEAHDKLEDRVQERTVQLRKEITQREKTQVELVRAKEAAEGANRAKSMFLANMSHEIRTPLNAVLGFTDLLRKGADQGDEAVRHEYLETIRTSGKHLLSLIDDVLDLSKVESGALDIERVRCSPHRLISEIVSVLRVRAHEKGLSLTSEWQGEIPETIETDPARFRQLLVNLVGNAIKFTETGGVKVVAKLRRRQPSAQLLIDVVDTGIGIPPESQNRIFDPFTQADNTVTRKYGGTGLGLAICRRIVEALDGTITLESQVGRGSTFQVTMDIGSLEGVPILESPPSDGVRSEGLKDRPTVSKLPPARILLADDGDTNRQLICVILEHAGAQVTTAENGQQAVDLAMEEQFDLILMDMQMPVMDGYAATGELRRKGITVPIVALTAHALKGDAEKCVEAGCTSYISKPVDVDALLQSVAGLLTDPSAPTPEAEPPPPMPLRSPNGPIQSTLPADPTFCRILQNFAKRLDEKLSVAREAAARSDFEELARLAHWLKGAGGTAGFWVFTEPAERLESAARARGEEEVSLALAEILDLAARIDVPVVESAEAKG